LTASFALDSIVIRLDSSLPDYSRRSGVDSNSETAFCQQQLLAFFLKRVPLKHFVFKGERMKLMVRVTTLACAIAVAASSAASMFPCGSIEECAALKFYQIPGPNPLIVVGPEAWESGELEVAGGVFKDSDGKFRFIYHGLQHDSDYSIGLATSDHPLGPWIKHGEPILPKGAKSDWDGGLAASGTVLHNGTHWQMWYIGAGSGVYSDSVNVSSGDCGSFCVGYATAKNLEGPWTKYYKGGKKGSGYIIASEASQDKKLKKPFETDGFYTGSMLFGPHTNNEYWLYVEAPVGEDDQGPLALWTSKSPTGPFKIKQYILSPGTTSATSWSKGGYSESKVVYKNNIFHLFFTGADGSSEDDDLDDDRVVNRTHPNRCGRKCRAFDPERPEPNSNEPENIGFAFSTDGMNFELSKQNPVAVHRESTPWNAAMAEGASSCTTLIHSRAQHYAHTLSPLMRILILSHHTPHTL
jgi:hypothetical protein